MFESHRAHQLFSCSSFPGIRDLRFRAIIGKNETEGQADFCAVPKEISGKFRFRLVYARAKTYPITLSSAATSASSDFR